MLARNEASAARLHGFCLRLHRVFDVHIPALLGDGELRRLLRRPGGGRGNESELRHRPEFCWGERVAQVWMRDDFMAVGSGT